MQFIDIVIVLCLSLGLYSGYRQGFVSQIISVAGLVIGFILARCYYIEVSDLYVTPILENRSISELLSFFSIWLSVILVVGLIGNFCSGILDKISLGWLNRFIGSIIGCVKYLFLLSLIIGIYDAIDKNGQVISETNKEQSLLYNPTKRVVENLYSLIKDNTDTIKKKISNIDFNI